MTLGQLTDRDAVIKAVAEFDALGSAAFLRKYGFGSSYRYALRLNGNEYDSKAIVGAAHGYQHPDKGPLLNTEFSGGNSGAAAKLRDLGFEVVLKDRLGPQDNIIQASLGEILDDYARARIQDPFSRDHPLLEAARNAAAAIRKLRPLTTRPDVVVRPSSGIGNWAKVPWIALMNPAETKTTQEGVYCVFLFRQDMSGVYLTLNQGVVAPRRERGAREARQFLVDRAKEVRLEAAHILEPTFATDDLIDLRADPGLGATYEVSTIAYKLYEAGHVPPDEQIESDLEQLLSAYDKYLEDREASGIEEALTANELSVDLEAVVADFADALKEAHVDFGSAHRRIVQSFVASLATKPFVLLTGLSGSGKTQIALRFGDWLGPDQRLLVAVRPDWTGSEALFGFEDALLPATDDGRRVWHVPDPLAFMLRAAADSQHPYLLILDEMNLAHVERYFADVLSGMESADPVLPNLTKEEDGLWRHAPGLDPLIPFPRNLLVVGTVNVDETTYMFSPKVLDRANVFEFRVRSRDLRSDSRRPVACRPGESHLVSEFLSIARDDSWQLAHPPPERETLEAHLRSLHELLTLHGFEFGFRMFYEVSRFAAILFAAGDSGELIALDLQVLQKVLPRLHGSRRRLEPVLRALALFAFNLDTSPSAADAFDPAIEPATDPVLPQSFDKVARMTRSVRVNQFASFTD